VAHSILLEVFTTEGIGTMVSADPEALERTRGGLA
jgi:acetylglutamate kinase